MALIAHYKLDGNAEDALGRHHGVASGVTWADGKLGGAGDFDGGSSYIDTGLGKEAYISDISVTLWAKFSDDSRGILVGNFDHAGGLGLEKHTGARLRVWFNGADYFTPTGVFTIGAWHHIAFVRSVQSGNWTLYVDGSVVGVSPSAGVWSNLGLETLRIGRDIRTGTTTVKGLLDDVRIYDHALSVREVRDLAMGLVLHYPCNQDVEAAENLYGSPQDGFSSVSHLVSSYVNYPNPRGLGNTVKKFYHPIEQNRTGDQRARTTFNGALTPGEAYTYSADVLLPAGQSLQSGTPHLLVRQGSSSDWLGTAIEQKMCPDALATADQWVRISITFTVREDLANIVHVLFYCRVAVENYFLATGGHLVKKPRATQFSIGVSEPALTDASTQGNDATLTLANSPEWRDEEYPGGRGYYMFGKYGQAIEVHDAPHITGSQTISMWLLPTSNSVRRNPINRGYGGEGTITHEPSGILNYFYGPNGANLSPYQPLSSPALPLNTWIHIALVRDLESMQLKWVFNGEVVAQASALYSHAGKTTTPLLIGNGYTGVYQGGIADVRIYSTALADDQVKELYRRRGSIDDQGNFYAAMFNEMGLKPGIGQSGELFADSVSEVGITRGLVAWYPLTGDTLDYVGTNHAVNNGAVATAEGYEFNRAERDSITVGQFNLFDGTKDFTVSVVASSTGVGGTDPHDCVFNPLSEGYFSIAVEATGYCVRYFTRTADGDIFDHISFESPHNTPVAITMVFDSTTRTITGYGNGEVIGEMGILGVPYSDGTVNYIGADKWVGQREYDGVIRDLRIHNVALTPEEVAIEYQRTGPNKVSITEGRTFIQGQFKEVTA